MVDKLNKNDITKRCKFADTCKRVGESSCNNLCFPFVFLHGTGGDTGVWATRNVPKSYDGCMVDNLPIESTNPNAYKLIAKYCGDVLSYVLDKGVGLFLYSIPNKDNPFGTGTGKTTSAVTILNTFTIAISREYLRGNVTLEDNPSLFIKASDLQNGYNEQFRGTMDMQQSASVKYYKRKAQMKKVPLLVIDDIAMRDITQAFESELYEVIDTRATNNLATIFTSNLAMAELTKILGERIVSRIDGMTVQVPFKGVDNRKGGLF